MNKKKTIYRVGIVIILALGYWNYFGEEKTAKKKEEVIETVGAVYKTEDYTIEADKQKDFLDKNETAFKKAKAILKGIVLTGDNGFLDAQKNLILKSNIFGKSINGWTFKTQEANYSKKTQEINSTVGVVVTNKKKGIEITGDKFKSDVTMKNIVLSGDVKLKVKDVIFYAKKVNYNDKNKIVDIAGDVTLGSKNENLKESEITGRFKGVKFNIKTNILTTNNPFVITNKGSELYGDSLIFNSETQKFNMTKNVHGILNGYKIKLLSISSNGGDVINFNGPIVGKNDEFSFYGDNAVYNKLTKLFILKGNVVGKNKDGGHLVADKAIYTPKNKELELLSKNMIKYTSPTQILKTKHLFFSNRNNNLILDEGYTYSDELYKSEGKKFLYNKVTKKGYVVEGRLKNIKTGQYISGDRIDFNREKNSYNIFGNALYQDGTYNLKSNKIYYVGSSQMIKFPEKYILTRSKEKDIFTGKKGEYNQKTKIFKSYGHIKYADSQNIIEGEDLKFNQQTGLGFIKKDIVITDLKNGTEISAITGQFKKDVFVKLQDRVVLTKQNIVVNAEEMEYKIKQQKVFIPGKIKFKDREKLSSGEMFDGVYNTKTKLLIGKDFKGKDNKNRYKSDKIEYNLQEKYFILRDNVVIKDATSVLKGQEFKYNLDKEIANSVGKFTLKYAVYNIVGKNGSLNKKTSLFDAQKVVIKSNIGEEFKGDIVHGTLDNMNLEFRKNVSGKIYQDGIPVYFSGNFLRVYFKKNKEGKDKIYRVVIKDNGVIKKQNYTLYSDYLEIQLDKNLILGKNDTKAVLIDEKNVKTTVTSDFLTGDLKSEIIDLFGNVRIKRVDNMKILKTKSNKAKLKNKDNFLELMGDVRVDNGETVITADEVDYNMDTNKVKARGNVFVDYKIKEKKTITDINQISQGYNKMKNKKGELMRTIIAHGLCKSYKKRDVVKKVSLEVKKGEIVGLLGPNGAGKTTTFYMITGIVKPDKGKIFIDEQNITNQPMYKRANMGIGYLAQEPSIFRNLTVEDNILAILEMKGFSKKSQMKKMKELLIEFKLTHVAKSMGYSLSGGERRRVEIARTIANNPDFILLDEPFAGVDPIAVEDIQQIIRYLKHKGLGILITDHSVRETLSITEKAYIMADGEILISGTPSEIARNKMAKKYI